MKIDITHIAKLARLKIDDSQVDKFQRQMQEIVNMVEQLPDIDGKIFVDPNNAMELRPDVIEPSLKRDALLANAPEVAAGCVVVPKTMEV